MDSISFFRRTFACKISNHKILRIITQKREKVNMHNFGRKFLKSYLYYAMVLDKKRNKKLRRKAQKIF